MIVSTSGRRQWSKLLQETPAKLPEKCTELFGNPRGNFALPGFHFCTQLIIIFFSSFETKFGRVVLLQYQQTYMWSSLLFLFHASVRIKARTNPSKNVKCTSQKLKKKNNKKKNVYVCWYCNEQLCQIWFSNSQNQGAKVWKKYGSPIAGTS